MLGKFSGVESERTISKFRKRNFVVFLPTSTKRAREIKNIHVAVVQRRLRKGVMHMQSCCSANLNLFLFLPFLLSLPSSFLKLLIELFSLYVFFFLMKVPGSLPRSRFLDVTQRSFGGALRDIQKNDCEGD